jgi:hypothetical protein
MASVGYGAYNFGVAAYGTPQYQVASATIAQTSDFDAVAGLTLVASATSAQTSGFTSSALLVKPGAAIIAQTSDLMQQPRLSN